MQKLPTILIAVLLLATVQAQSSMDAITTGHVYYEGSNQAVSGVTVWSSCYDNTQYGMTDAQGEYYIRLVDCPVNAVVTSCNDYECKVATNKLVVEGVGVVYNNLETLRVQLVLEQFVSGKTSCSGVSTKHLWCPSYQGLTHNCSVLACKFDKFKQHYEFMTYQVRGCGDKPLCNIKSTGIRMWEYQQEITDNTSISRIVCA